MSDELFPDVPRNETKLEAWKRIHGVTTDGNGDPGATLWRADSCNREYGETEEQACRNLALKLNLGFLETITQSDLRPL